MNILFYDTETTGLPDWKNPSDSPAQPHIVQLAALLVDDETRAVVAQMNRIVKPNGWTISEEVAAIHGITHEMALTEGINEEEVLNEFLGLWKTSDSMHTRIAHNETFDARIIRIATLRYSKDEMLHALWKGGRALCTQTMSTPILRIPPTGKMRAAGFNKFKSTNLGEAFKHLTGKYLEGAHDAMVDVCACRDIYFAIQDATKQKEIEEILCSESNDQA